MRDTQVVERLADTTDPQTLLSIEDQIVYQALANVVARRLYPRVRHRYNKVVM